jgi:hypothetical protein
MNSFDESTERGTRSHCGWKGKLAHWWASTGIERERTLPWNSQHCGSWCFTVHLCVSTIEHHEKVVRCYHSSFSLLVFLCFCTDLTAPKDSMYHLLNIIITLYSWLYKAHIISPYSQQTGSGNWYPRWRFPRLFLSWKYALPMSVAHKSRLLSSDRKATIRRPRRETTPE